MGTGMITTLLSSGADTFTNLFDVEVTFPTFLADDPIIIGNTTNAITMSVRAQGFTPPTGFTVPEYEVKYKAVTIKKPGATIQGDRTFSLKFRANATLGLYDSFMKWKHLLVDPSGESNLALNIFYTNQSGDARGGKYVGHVEVKALFPDDTAFTSDPNTGDSWIFSKVLVLDVTLDPFSRDGGNTPQTFDVKFMYVYMSEPGHNPDVNVDDTVVPVVALNS